MDALFFKCNNRESLFKELGIPEEFSGRIYESRDGWVLEWLGRLPAEMETKIDDEGIEYQIVKSWQDGEYFNIYLKGQNNMDFFTQGLMNGTLLAEPATPNAILL